MATHKQHVLQCSPASVDLAQARPNCYTFYMAHN